MAHAFSFIFHILPIAKEVGKRVKTEPVVLTWSTLATRQKGAKNGMVKNDIDTKS